MTKKEIFNHIIETCAHVCNVEVSEIINACRKEDVCTARAILVFWCDAAGFTSESLAKLCECNNAQSINAVRQRIETLWVERYAFHLLVFDVGARLHEIALNNGCDFDMYVPLKRIAKATGKY